VQIPSESPCRNSQSLAKIQIQLNFEFNFHLNLLLGSGLASPVHPCRPSLPHRLLPPRSTQPTRDALGYLTKDVFPSGLRISLKCLFSFSVSDMWFPHVRPIFCPPALPRSAVQPLTFAARFLPLPVMSATSFEP
jgi:hypothetical protein